MGNPFVFLTLWQVIGLLVFKVVVEWNKHERQSKIRNKKTTIALPIEE